MKKSGVILLIVCVLYKSYLHCLADSTSSESGEVGDGGDGCKPPRMSLLSMTAAAASHPRNSISAGSISNNFNGVQEVQFHGIVGPIGQRRVCKIKCVNGAWLGPLCSFEEDGGRFQPLLRSCRLDRPLQHIVFAAGGRFFLPLLDTRFSHGTTVRARCTDVGRFKFVGNSTVKCKNGQWEQRLPSCIPTTALTNFSAFAPPTIEWKTGSKSGAVSVSDSGELVVYPGSIIHIDCLFLRKLGNPKWNWTPAFRQYPTGWAMTPHEREWKYRISIYYTKPFDSGQYTCTTPPGISNSVYVRVKAIDCPEIENADPNLQVSSEGVKMNSKTDFFCEPGSQLIGSSEITCLWTGQWSDHIPICEAILCPAVLSSDSQLKISSHNRTYRSHVEFSCPPGHRLIGGKEAVCILGNWTSPVPTCQAVFCEPPMPPTSGTVQTSEKPTVGDLVQFMCEPGFRMIGEAQSVCSEMGTWADPPPKCVASCLHPGEPMNGRIVPTRPYYTLGNVVTVMCNQDFILNGVQQLKCIKAETWSHPLPECRPFRSQGEQEYAIPEQHFVENTDVDTGVEIPESA